MVESVVLLQDRPSSNLASTAAARASHPQRGHSRVSVKRLPQVGSKQCGSRNRLIGLRQLDRLDWSGQR